MKRAAVAALLTLALTRCEPVAPPPPPQPPPPATASSQPRAEQAPEIPEVPVTETFFGATVTDPYRWMEDKGDPRFVALMKREGERARATLDAIPARRALFERVHQLSGGVEEVRGVVVANGRCFYEKRPAGADNFMLYTRPLQGGAEKVLVDPTKMGTSDTHVALDGWSPSPDGRYLIYGTSPAGSEESVARIMAVESGELLPESIDRILLWSVSWLPDGSGLFFWRRREGTKPGAEDTYKDGINWLHRLRTEPAKDEKILARGMYPELPVDDKEFPLVLATPGSPYVMAIPAGGVRKDNPLYLAGLADVVARKPRWTKVGGLDDEIRNAVLRGTDLYVLTTRGADRGKVLRTSAAAPDLAKATVVVPEGRANIEDIVAAKDALYVTLLDGGYGGLLRLADGAKAPSPVKLPFDGAIAGYAASTAEEGVSLTLGSWFQPVGAWRFAKGALADLGLGAKPALDTSGYEAIRTFATARDGAKIPLSILAKKGLARDGSAPALVYAYGSYQLVLYPPAFEPTRLAFLEKGGVIAVAGVRGGGEYGKPWWKAGQRLNKPNTWHDLVDTSEALVKEGWTSPKKLATEGFSAGGITAGRALTERPDLFAAVIVRSGCLNPLRMEFSPNGPSNIDEFGTVADADGFKGLLAMDATQAVKQGAAYPAVLLMHGMTDPRVEPWQSAKMFAHLVKASSSHAPILLRVAYDEGHGMGATRTHDDEETADVYAFVLWRAGAAGASP
jgi:prolyl oligopeptidase